MLKRILVLLLLIPSLCIAQFSIKGTFSPAEDYNTILLYNVTPTVSKYIKKADIQEDGSFEFKLDSTATQGMYRVVYAVPQEDYNFDVIYNKKEDVVLEFNAETGLKFIESVENKMISSYTNSMSMLIQSISNYYKSKSKDTTALNTIFKTQKETQNNFEEQAKNLLALNFIKASRPYIPNKYESAETYMENLKKHYFDFFDVNNKFLLSSSFIQERMLNYVFGVTDSSLSKADNYINNIDTFYKVISKLPLKVKRILLVDLWGQLKDLEFESVSNHISEQYLMDIAVELNDQELLHNLLILTNTAIGVTAPDFSWNNKEKKETLLELNTADTYVIVFWSTGCSHCLNDIPKLYKFITTRTENTSVVAIALENTPKTWNTLVQDYPEFIHVYGDDKWENKIALTYGINKTPSFFILDKNKTIISKPETIETLEAFFEESGL